MGERVNEDFKLIRKVLEIQRKIKHFVYIFRRSTDLHVQRSNCSVSVKAFQSHLRYFRRGVMMFESMIESIVMYGEKIWG
jgi:hypothetical protein